MIEKKLVYLYVRISIKKIFKKNSVDLTGGVDMHASHVRYRARSVTTAWSIPIIKKKKTRIIINRTDRSTLHFLLYMYIRYTAIIIIPIPFSTNWFLVYLYRYNTYIYIYTRTFCPYFTTSPSFSRSRRLVSRSPDVCNRNINSHTCAHNKENMNY